MNPQALLSVTVKDRKQIFFQGKAKAVSSQNNKGVFDVLPKHANFICLIKDKVTVYSPDKQKQEIPLKTGVLKVWENEVNVYLGV